MKLAICDDDKINVEKTGDLIRRYCEEKQIENLTVTAFHSAFELLECQSGGFDVILLDIEMPGIDGISAAREIRTRDQKVILIFMTNYVKYAIEGYSVQAYNYLLKPISYEVISRELDTVLHKIHILHDKMISMNTESGFLTINVDEIEMVETNGKNVLLHTYKKDYLVYRSMKQMESELDDSLFFRIHTAYLISMAAVKQVGKDTVLLRSGKTLPLSRHRKKEFMDTYMEYIGGFL